MVACPSVAVRILATPAPLGTRQNVQPPDPRFASLEWTFARIRYDAWTLPPGRRYDIFDEPWTIDAPAAEQNLSRRVKTVTAIQVDDPSCSRSRIRSSGTIRGSTSSSRATCG